MSPILSHFRKENMAKKKEIKGVRFRNKKGEVMVLPNNLTLKQLVIMGFSNFNIVNPKKPLRKNEWRSEE